MNLWICNKFQNIGCRPDVYQKIIFLISQPKNMLWVLKRTVSMRRFFWAPKTYVQTDGLENIYNFKLKSCVYLNLWCWPKLQLPFHISGGVYWSALPWTKSCGFNHSTVINWDDCQLFLDLWESWVYGEFIYKSSDGIAPLSKMDLQGWLKCSAMRFFSDFIIFEKAKTYYGHNRAV